jgi:murein DD-endopeptidase MepM/ murein hydrolase activator NlpD
MRTLAALAVAAVLCLSAAAVNAQTLPEPVPTEPPAAEPAAEPGAGETGEESPIEAPGGDAEVRSDKDRGGKGRGGKGRRKLRLLRANAQPSKAWFKGRPAVFHYAIDGRRPRNVVIQVKRKGRDPKIVRRFERKRVSPRKAHTVEWDGRVDGGKKYARQGTYKFKVRAKRGPAAEMRNAAGKPRAGFYKHKFPVRGRHSYGDGIGAGRGHRGVDVFARCGTKLQAARAGKVQYRAYQGSGAGHYVVIDGKKDGKDYVYMHLRRAARASAGEKVRTGETIGRVGATGNATGCHLHFELWSSPGWYEGGDFLDPMPKLRSWDRFS